MHRLKGIGGSFYDLIKGNRNEPLLKGQSNRGCVSGEPPEGYLIGQDETHSENVKITNPKTVYSELQKKQQSKEKHEKLKISTEAEQNRYSENSTCCDNETLYDERPTNVYGGKATGGYDRRPRSYYGGNVPSDYGSMYSVNSTDSSPRLQRLRSEPDLAESRIYYFKDVKNSIIAPGASSSNILSDSRKEEVDLRSRVNTRTTAALERFEGEFGKQNFTSSSALELGVETEGCTRAMENLMRPHKNRLAIFIGNGDGATFNSLKMLYELSKIEPDGPKNKPYILKDTKECGCVDRQSNAIIVIPDASGTTLYDPSKLNDWIWCIEHELIPQAGQKFTVIMTLKSFKEVDYNEFKIKHREYVIDLTSLHQITESTKEKLFSYHMKKYLGNLPDFNAINEVRKIDQPLLFCEETKENILRKSKRRGFARKVSEFFKGNLHCGVDFFIEPSHQDVDEINLLPKPQLLTLMVVDAYGGQLGIDRIYQLQQIQLKSGKGLRYSVDTNLHIAHRVDRLSKSVLFADVPVLKLRMLCDFVMKHKLSDVPSLLRDSLSRLVERDLLERIEGRYVYRFPGESVRNALLISVGSVYPHGVLNTCDKEFLYKFVGSHDSFGSEKLGLYIGIEDDACADAIKERLQDELLSGKVKDVTRHPIMGNDRFLDKFIPPSKERIFKFKNRKSSWDILSQTDSDKMNPYCILFYGIENKFGKISKRIIEHGTWKNKRKEKKWKEWTANQEREALLHAAELGRETDFAVIINLGIPVTIEMLNAAIESGSGSIVQTITKYGKFSYIEWCESLLYALKCSPKQSNNEQTIAIMEALKLKADINYIVEGFQPLVHFAANENDIAMLNILERVNADLDLMYDKQTALIIAIQKGYDEFVKCLLERGSDQRKPIHMQDLPIHKASSNGQTNILQMLLDSNPLIIKEKNTSLQNPLHLAAYQGHEDVIELLLQSKEVELNSTDIDGNSPLQIAARKGNTGIVSLLVRHGTDPQHQNKRNETALSIACMEKNYPIVEVLLEVYVSKESVQDDKILTRAVEAMDFELLDILLKYGYSLDIADSERGTLLIQALQRNSYDMVEYLLKHKANAENWNPPPIHGICARGDIKMLKLLLSYGANIAAKESQTGDTIVHIESAKASNKMIEQIFDLPECSSLVNAINVKEETALHIACRVGSVKIVELLLRNEFSPLTLTTQNETPIDIACKEKDNAKRNNATPKVDAYNKIIELLKIRSRREVDQSTLSTDL